MSKINTNRGYEEEQQTHESHAVKNTKAVDSRWQAEKRTKEHNENMIW